MPEVRKSSPEKKIRGGEISRHDVDGRGNRLFRNLIYEESGIYLKDTRKDFLETDL